MSQEHLSFGREGSTPSRATKNKNLHLVNTIRMCGDGSLLNYVVETRPLNHRPIRLHILHAYETSCGCVLLRGQIRVGPRSLISTRLRKQKGYITNTWQGDPYRLRISGWDHDVHSRSSKDEPIIFHTNKIKVIYTPKQMEEFSKLPKIFKDGKLVYVGR